VSQVKFFHSARFTADKNDIHKGFSSYAVVVHQIGALCPMED